MHQLGRGTRREPGGVQRRVLQDFAQRRIRNTLRCRRNQCRTHDAGAVVPRMLASVRQHRHAAHRMADQHDRPARCDHLQHRLQVLTELGDRVGLRRRLSGATVPALIVEDHPDVGTPLLAQPHALKMESAHAQTESVCEHHCQCRILGPDLAHRQGHPVGGGHHAAPVVVQRFEILAGERIVDDRAPGQLPRNRHRGDRADRAQSRGTRQPRIAGARITSAQRFRLRGRSW